MEDYTICLVCKNDKIYASVGTNNVIRWDVNNFNEFIERVLNVPSVGAQNAARNRTIKTLSPCFYNGENIVTPRYSLSKEVDKILFLQFDFVHMRPCELGIRSSANISFAGDSD